MTVADSVGLRLCKIGPDLRRHFYPSPIFVKWHHIQEFLVFPKGITATVPSKTNSAGKRYTFRRAYSMTMVRVLSFLVSRQRDEDDHDVTQAFFGSQKYVAEETQMTRAAVSRALSALVDAGILVKAKVGNDTLYAFSQRTIDALLVYSQEMTEEEEEEEEEMWA